jgi:hypothetical protein
MKNITPSKLMGTGLLIGVIGIGSYLVPALIELARVAHPADIFKSLLMLVGAASFIVGFIWHIERGVK